jgi:branched-subunit amino acid transport protein AzlD
LDFAMTALFTVLAIDAYRARRDIPTPVLALACALIARLVVPGQLLLAHPARALPDVLALAVTIALHRWRRNAVLSILGGTVIYAVLVGTLFAG